MIGNDVIDLELARSQSNWKRKGFLEKIFTSNEQRLILDSADPELMVWAFWSRKESAYKIFNRQTALRLYNPKQFECSAMQYADGFHYGEVNNGGIIYHSRTEIHSRFIHTVVVENKDDFRVVDHCESGIEIRKRNNIPFMADAHGAFIKPISISHHGIYKRIVSF